MMKKLLFVIAAVCAAAAVSAQGEVLKLTLQKGDVFNQKMAVSSKMTQNVFGQQMDVNSEMTGELRYEVVGMEDGNYIIEVQYTKLAMAMKSPAAQMDVSGSSENTDAGDMFSPMFGLMVGKPFRMTMSPTGRIVKLDDVEKLYEGFSGLEILKSLPAEAADQIIQQVKESYGGESLKSNMEKGSAIFPETPVNVGDSWTIDTTVETAMSLKMQMKYTLVEKTAGHILIKSETEVKTGDGLSEVSGISVKYDLAGTMTSEMKLDPKTCWTDSSESTMNMSGNMVMLKNEQIPMDMTIPLTMEITTTYANF